MDITFLCVSSLTGSLARSNSGIVRNTYNIRNLSLRRTLFEHCHFGISPRLLKCYQNFNPTLLHWATHVFSNGLRKYAI